MQLVAGNAPEHLLCAGRGAELHALYAFALEPQTVL